jgi:hypothetical protein
MSTIAKPSISEGKMRIELARVAWGIGKVKAALQDTPAKREKPAKRERPAKHSLCLAGLGNLAGLACRRFSIAPKSKLYIIAAT